MLPCRRDGRKKGTAGRLSCLSVCLSVFCRKNEKRYIDYTLPPVGQIGAIITSGARRSVSGREVIEEVAGARPVSITTKLRRNFGLVGQHLDDDADAVLPTNECLLMVGYLSKITGERGVYAFGGWGGGGYSIVTCKHVSYE